MSGDSNLQDVRWDYESAPLRRADLRSTPLQQFLDWLDQARASESSRCNVMTVATMGDWGPDARVALLKDASAEGLTFFTDYRSEKAQQIDLDARTCLVFHWPSLHRQVRIHGFSQRCSRAISEEYFATRPRDSQLAARTSHQSRHIKNREELQNAFALEEARHPADQSVPAPDHWGGYTVTPTLWEFWQGQPGRLHDRFRFAPTEDGWVVDRLQP